MPDDAAASVRGRWRSRVSRIGPAPPRGRRMWSVLVRGCLCGVWFGPMRLMNQRTMLCHACMSSTWVDVINGRARSFIPTIFKYTTEHCVHTYNNKYTPEQDVVLRLPRALPLATSIQQHLRRYGRCRGHAPNRASKSCRPVRALVLPPRDGGRRGR